MLSVVFKTPSNQIVFQLGMRISQQLVWLSMSMTIIYLNTMYLTRELYEGQIMVSQKETGESIIMVPRDHSFFFNEKVGTKFQIAKQWAKDIHLKYSTSENLQKKM